MRGQIEDFYCVDRFLLGDGVMFCGWDFVYVFLFAPSFTSLSSSPAPSFLFCPTKLKKLVIFVDRGFSLM